MEKYWIFVSVPYTDFNMGTIREMAEKMKVSKKWPIGKNTPLRQKLSENDRVLFYQGGEKGRKIVGSAELGSRLISGGENSLFDFVMIRKVALWKKSVEIKTVLNKLSFIKNKKRWGIYFRGGVIKIAEKDYKEILRARKSDI